MRFSVPNMESKNHYITSSFEINTRPCIIISLILTSVKFTGVEVLEHVQYLLEFGR